MRETLRERERDRETLRKRESEPTGADKVLRLSQAHPEGHS